MIDSRPTEPMDDCLPEECPVCKRDNVDADGEFLLPSGHCSEACQEHEGHGSYSWRGMDSARYVGDGDNGIYYSAGKGPDGWYSSVVVYCEHFTDDMISDDGPYDSEADAWQAGQNTGIEWCWDNQVSYEEDQESA